jgi:hypothetical protein
LGCAVGILTVSMPSEANTASNDAPHLVFAAEEPERGDSVVEVGHEVADGLRGPHRRRVRGDAKDVDATTGDLHDEQTIESA